MLTPVVRSVAVRSFGFPDDTLLETVKSVTVYGSKVTIVQAGIGLAGCSGAILAAIGTQATFPVKRRLPSLEETNYCTHFSLRRGHHFREDNKSGKE
jgi:hypothetical protein